MPYSSLIFGATFDLDAYHTNCDEIFDALCSEAIPLKPGSLELLDFLRRKQIPTAIATSTDGTKAKTQLQKAGLLDQFDVVVTRTEVAHGKPHPETCLTAAKALRARPRNCLALEDSHNGVRAAAAAGMVTFMIPDLLEPTDESDCCAWPSSAAFLMFETNSPI